MADTQEGFIEFSKKIRNAESSHIHKIRNSYGVYDGFRYYRKTKPKEDKYILNQIQYLAITRYVNKMLSESLIHGEDVIFPHRMGKLELRKYNSNIKFEDGKLKTNLSIDWNKTLRLWHEDKESYDKKTLVRVNKKELFRIIYNRKDANYNNKNFYQFTVTREIRKHLNDNIKNNEIDAFIIK